MSNRLLNMVRDAKIGDPTAKELLKCIADQSNDHGANVWSSIAYFEFATERNRSTIKRALAFLKDEGFIEDAGWTKYGTHVWRVNVDVLAQVQRTWRKDYEEGVQTEPGGAERTEGEVQTEPLTPIEPKNKNTGTLCSVEPEYVDDVDGVPDERQIEWMAFLKGWEECFPGKAQPRKTNTAIRNKFYARLKDAGFKANWRQALWNTKPLKWAHSEGWFKAKWFVHNNDNYEKLLDGTYDFKENQTPQQVTQPARKVQADISVEDWENRRTK